MELYINKDTQLCMSLAARPGNFGTRFHNFLYRELGLNYIYKAFTTRDLAAAIGGIRALGIRGCAISMPFKEACIEYLDELDPSAKGIMSVNTIVNTDGYLKAYNTDYTAVSELLGSSGIPPALISRCEEAVAWQRQSHARSRTPDSKMASLWRGTRQRGAPWLSSMASNGGRNYE